MISSDARTCSDQYSLFTRCVSLSADRSQDSTENTEEKEEKEINMKAVRSSIRTSRESEGPGSPSSCDVPYAKVRGDEMRCGVDSIVSFSIAPFLITSDISSCRYYYYFILGLVARTERVHVRTEMSTQHVQQNNIVLEKQNR